jgi:hypothetical protein
MAAQSERVRPDADEASAPRPIELITENDYSIVRLWELNDEPAPAGGSFTFVVSALDGERETVVVEIAREVMVAIEVHTRGRILSSNSFWICCAEKHLAAHLSKHDEAPRDGRLRVETLTPADVNLSIRWERT